MMDRIVYFLTDDRVYPIYAILMSVGAPLLMMWALT